MSVIRGEGLGQRFHSPVGGVVLGNVGRPGVVDHPLDQGKWQHDFAPGQGDERVA